MRNAVITRTVLTRIAFLAVTLVVAAGCFNECDVASSRTPFTELAAKDLTGVWTSGGYTLEFTADGRFAINDVTGVITTGGTLRQPGSGTWTLDFLSRTDTLHDQVNLAFAAIGGQSSAVRAAIYSLKPGSQVELDVAASIPGDPMKSWTATRHFTLCTANCSHLLAPAA